MEAARRFAKDRMWPERNAPGVDPIVLASLALDRPLRVGRKAGRDLGIQTENCMRTATKLILLTATLALLTGTGCAATRNGSMASVTPVTSNQRVGSVYLLRGWIGVFSTGINSLGDKLKADGVNAQVYQEAQWSELANTIVAKYEKTPNHEPIVLVGHSYGADDSILITRKLAEHNIKVDLVVTLDPVTPKKVPSNVNHVYNLYQSSALDGLPFLRGIPLTPESPGPVALDNLNIRKDRTDLLDSNLDHFNIEKKEKIHADVIAQVLKVCPPRAAWVAMHATPAPVAASPAVAAVASRGMPAALPPGVTVTSTIARPAAQPVVGPVRTVALTKPADAGSPKVEAYVAH